MLPEQGVSYLCNADGLAADRVEDVADGVGDGLQLCGGRDDASFYGLLLHRPVGELHQNEASLHGLRDRQTLARGRVPGRTTTDTIRAWTETQRHRHRQTETERQRQNQESKRTEEKKEDKNERRKKESKKERKIWSLISFYALVNSWHLRGPLQEGGEGFTHL